SGGMHDESDLVLPGLHVPQFLQPDAVDLRARVLAQAELCFELAGEMPAAAFGEERVLRAQLDSRLVAAGLLALAADSHVAGRNAVDASVLAVQHLRR